jgi:hypothetical protein
MKVSKAVYCLELDRNIPSAMFLYNDAFMLKESAAGVTLRHKRFVILTVVEHIDTTELLQKFVALYEVSQK